MHFYSFLNLLLWQFLSNLKTATQLPQTFGEFLKITAIEINKKILQIIDFAGYIYFLMPFENIQ